MRAHKYNEDKIKTAVIMLGRVQEGTNSVHKDANAHHGTKELGRPH